ncbi:MAG TPA: hypothetical protein VGK73_32255 [Polyangiaceae bacterium]
MKIEQINEQASALLTAINLEAHHASDQVWDMVGALVRISGEVLPRGLGMLQAFEACNLVAARQGVKVHELPHGMPNGCDWEGRSMCGIAFAPWLSLTAQGQTGARHREAFERYRAHDARLSAALPEPAAPWSEWGPFLGGVEVSSYTSGEAQARVYLAAVEPTPAEVCEARAYAWGQLREHFEAHRDIVTRAHLVPPAAPVAAPVE